MLLAIDAGNTNMLFAVYDGDTKRGYWRLSTDARRTSDEYAVWLMALMTRAGLQPEDIDAAILSSVVPAATFNLSRLCKDHFGCDPMRVGDPDVKLGIGFDYPNPREVGADRIANAVAAVTTYGAPVVVVDFGTGTNFDIVDREGRFAGGVIAAGPNLALDALHRVAAQLPKVEVLRPDSAIGKSTVSAMQSGMYWGYTGMIEGLLTRIEAELSPTGDLAVTVVATGGMGRVFTGATPMIDHYDADLTIRGLLHIHQLNSPGKSEAPAATSGASGVK